MGETALTSFVERTGSQPKLGLSDDCDVGAYDNVFKKELLGRMAVFDAFLSMVGAVEGELVMESMPRDPTLPSQEGLEMDDTPFVARPFEDVV